MHPVLFEIGPVKLYSFGLMVMLAFLSGGLLVTSELTRRRLEPNHLEGYPMMALLGGIVGARVYYLLAHFSELTHDPWGSLLSGAGLTWYGGLLGGALATLWLAHRKRQPLFSLCDSFAPGLAIAYAVGRVGCQLAGDGDYGPPSDLPWAMAYPHGVVPTTVPVHPTPVYEILMMSLVTWILWRLRLRPRPAGWLFALYLMLAGAERWISEWFRVRDSRTLGLSVAQWLSLGVVALGLWLFLRRRRHAA